MTDPVFVESVRVTIRANYPALLRSLVTTVLDPNAEKRARIGAAKLILIGVKRGAWDVPPEFSPPTKEYQQ